MHFQNEEVPQADGNAHVQMLSPRVRDNWETTGIPSIVPPSSSHVLRLTAMRLVHVPMPVTRLVKGETKRNPRHSAAVVANRSNLEAGTQNEGPARERS